MLDSSAICLAEKECGPLASFQSHNGCLLSQSFAYERSPYKITAQETCERTTEQCMARIYNALRKVSTWRVSVVKSVMRARVRWHALHAVPVQGTDYCHDRECPIYWTFWRQFSSYHEMLGIQDENHGMKLRLRHMSVLYLWPLPTQLVQKMSASPELNQVLALSLHAPLWSSS